MRHAVLQTSIHRRLDEASFYFESERKIPSLLKDSVVSLAQEAGKQAVVNHNARKHAVLKGLIGGIAVSYRALAESDTYDFCMLTVHETLVHITDAVSSQKIEYERAAENLGSKFIELYGNAGPHLFRLATCDSTGEPIKEQKVHAHTVGFIGSIATSRLIQYTVLGD